MYCMYIQYILYIRIRMETKQTDTACLTWQYVDIITVSIWLCMWPFYNIIYISQNKCVSWCGDGNININTQNIMFRYIYLVSPPSSRLLNSRLVHVENFSRMYVASPTGESLSPRPEEKFSVRAITFMDLLFKMCSFVKLKGQFTQITTHWWTGY